MRKSIYRKRPLDFFKSAILPALFTVVIISMIIFGLNNAEYAGRAEGLRTLEDSIRRAVVIAYAIEGRYPASIEYIREHFGIHIDETRFIVHYRVIAPNVLPEITVIAR
ncbi:MAG: hypothetical protein FWC20_01460 [Oscillospiraceae bacterium]|nr:hypothetical protein [Oscillospiraceae bacterium]MCL2278060.1 hypothetical protein [Oscillospiraceae bacterium]